jgi:hypothetical protein
MAMNGTTSESELLQPVLAESSADSSPRDESFEDEDANDDELNANAVSDAAPESNESDNDGEEPRSLKPLAALDTSSEVDDTTLLATPTFATAGTRNSGATASTKKFVQFLSQVESTPIQSSSREVFADDIQAITLRNQPRIEEGAEDDEKKEEMLTVADTPNADVLQNSKGLISESPAKAKISSDYYVPKVASPTRERSDSCPDISTPASIPSLPIIPSPASATIAPLTSPSRVSPPGRRTITLHLLEEVDGSTSNTKTSPFQKFSSLRRFRSLSLSTVMVPLDEKNKAVLADALESKNEPSVVDRGILTVSWYEGTTSSEMQEHVFNCVLRKLKSVTCSSDGGEKRKLEDVRLLDESVVPHEGMFDSYLQCVDIIEEYIFGFAHPFTSLMSLSQQK